MTNEHIAQLLERLDSLEHMLVINRDHPKEETFSRKMYDLEQKVIHMHDIFDMKLDQILEQTTKTNGRVTKLEGEINNVKITHITESAVLRGKTTVVVAVIGFVASVAGAIITFFVTKHL